MVFLQASLMPKEIFKDSEVTSGATALQYALINCPSCGRKHNWTRVPLYLQSGPQVHSPKSREV